LKRVTRIVASRQKRQRVELGLLSTRNQGEAKKAAVVVAKRRGIAPHAKAKADSLHAQTIHQLELWHHGEIALSARVLAGIRTYRRIIKWLTVAVAVLES